MMPCPYYAIPLNRTGSEQEHVSPGSPLYHPLLPFSPTRPVGAPLRPFGVHSCFFPPMMDAVPPMLMPAPPIGFGGGDGAVEGPLYGPGPPIVTGEHLKGPVGCNLFVFHLPNEITNWDLYLLFRRYGTILSVHIMVNKLTGLSKGYGFVSFANPHDAQNAIEAMDGFRLGKKRLKVQLKRLHDDREQEFVDWEEVHTLRTNLCESDDGKGTSHCGSTDLEENSPTSAPEKDC